MLPVMHSPVKLPVKRRVAVSAVRLPDGLCVNKMICPGSYRWRSPLATESFFPGTSFEAGRRMPWFLQAGRSGVWRARSSACNCAHRYSVEPGTHLPLACGRMLESPVRVSLQVRMALAPPPPPPARPCPLLVPSLQPTAPHPPLRSPGPGCSVCETLGRSVGHTGARGGCGGQARPAVQTASHVWPDSLPLPPHPHPASAGLCLWTQPPAGLTFSCPRLGLGSWAPQAGEPPSEPCPSCACSPSPHPPAQAGGLRLSSLGTPLLS